MWGGIVVDDSARAGLTDNHFVFRMTHLLALLRMFDISFVVKVTSKRCATFWQFIWHGSYRLMIPFGITLTHSRTLSWVPNRKEFNFFFFFGIWLSWLLLDALFYRPLWTHSPARTQAKSSPNIKLLFVERKQEKQVWKRFSPFGRFIECPPFRMCIISTWVWKVF